MYCLRRNCPPGPFVPWGVLTLEHGFLSLGTFLLSTGPDEVFSGNSVSGCFIPGTFCLRTFCLILFFEPPNHLEIAVLYRRKNALKYRFMRGPSLELIYWQLRSHACFALLTQLCYNRRHPRNHLYRLRNVL
jgi:hypothetical protein